MPVLINDEENVKITFNLIENNFLDFEAGREDYENWIPFELLLTVEEERYEYLESSGATLTLFEAKDLIKNIDRIVNDKCRGKNIKKYQFSSSEGFFELMVDETFEEELVYIEFWINIGTYTSGGSYGYDKGFRFIVSVSELKNFCIESKLQLHSIVN